MNTRNLEKQSILIVRIILDAMNRMPDNQGWKLLKSAYQTQPISEAAQARFNILKLFNVSEYIRHNRTLVRIGIAPINIRPQTFRDLSQEEVTWVMAVFTRHVENLRNTGENNWKIPLPIVPK